MRNVTYKYMVFFGLIAVMLFQQHGVAKTVTEDELKAAYVFRFAQYTIWPKPLEKRFRLCLLGDNNVTYAIEKYSGRLIKGVPFTTFRPSSSTVPEDCDAVFLSTNKRGELRNWINLWGRQSILLISDAPGAFEEKIDIALLTEPNKITFSINQTQARARMFLFSGQMLKLAQKIR